MTLISYCPPVPSTSNLGFGVLVSAEMDYQKVIWLVSRWKKNDERSQSPGVPQGKSSTKATGESNIRLAFVKHNQEYIITVVHLETRNLFEPLEAQTGANPRDVSLLITAVFRA